MSKNLLKKFISKKQIKALLSDIETLIQSPICIKDDNGKVLIGNAEKKTYEYPVSYDNKLGGWVCGEEKVSTIANLLSLWLTLENEKSTLGQELLEKYREITFYFNITEQLAGNLDTKDVAQFLIDEAKRLIKNGDISILLFENAATEMLASSTSKENALETLHVCKYVVDNVRNNGKAEVINDFPSDPRYIYGKTTAASVMCSPLSINDKVLGVIIVTNEETTNYTAGDLKMLSSIAYQTAAAIENAKLIAKLKETIIDLQNKKEELTHSIKIRMEFSHIFISVVLMFCLYTFLLAILNNLNAGDKEIYVISRLVEITFVIANVWLVFRSGLPLSSFGITLANSKKAIIESLFISAVLMILLTFLKLFLIKTLPSLNGQPVITWKYVGWDYATYILVAPLQEFLTRGVLQGSIQRFLVGPLNWLWATILTSSLFGVFHIHESLELGIIAIIGGILWGVMYVRHKTLIGVSISHFLVGNWLGILGLWNMITHTAI